MTDLYTFLNLVKDTLNSVFQLIMENWLTRVMFAMCVIYSAATWVIWKNALRDDNRREL